MFGEQRGANLTNEISNPNETSNEIWKPCSNDLKLPHLFVRILLVLSSNLLQVSKVLLRKAHPYWAVHGTLSYWAAKWSTPILFSRLIHSRWFHPFFLPPEVKVVVQWDFQGPPTMGPPYGKRDPYYSHTTPIRIPYWGSLKSPLSCGYIF